MVTETSSLRKAKIAQRVFEVIDYFDDSRCEATVMDIARRFARPQSSTSELLSVLVELGILLKNPLARTYSLAPRTALLGTAGQPELLRDGRLVRLMDRLVAQTGLTAALHSIAGPHAQVVSCRHAPRAADTLRLTGGVKEPLFRSAIGWLLLSTIARPHRDGLMRRLNAEADDASKFSYGELMTRIECCGRARYAYGPAGFGTDALAVARLIPRRFDQPLTISIVYDSNEHPDPQILLQCINEATAKYLPSHCNAQTVKPLHAA